MGVDEGNEQQERRGVRLEEGVGEGEKRGRRKKRETTSLYVY